MVEASGLHLFQARGRLPAFSRTEWCYTKDHARVGCRDVVEFAGKKARLVGPGQQFVSQPLFLGVLGQWSKKAAA